MNKSLHIFLIFAFLSMSIAPACGFSWGGTYSVIEICGAQGTKLQLVDNKDLPGAPEQSHQDCPFCLTQAKIAFLASHEPPFITANFAYERLIFAVLNQKVSQNAVIIPPSRGPPSFI